MPSCEILSIGTELLLGQILNTNSQFLSTELASIGIGCYFQTTVGDNKERIVETIRHALNRSDVLLITGGLGPTADDLTTECVAQVFGSRLVYDAEVMERIEEFFKTRGITMPETNRKQALRPDGASILPNPTGTAPGIIWKLEEQALQFAGILESERPRVIMTFPGVPSEMKRMWKETARPHLAREFGQNTVWSIDLKHYGIGESALAEKYAHLLELSNPTVAPYAGSGECKLRISAYATSVDNAKLLAQPLITEILSESAELCYGCNDETLESVVGKLLLASHKTLTTAESCTGGLVSKRLTDIPGASAYTHLNLVTYANEAKQKFLGVNASTIETHGAVSEECAREMAIGARKISGADLAVAITGVAGPDGGTEAKPVGLVYLALSDAEATKVKRIRLPQHLGRDDIRQRSSSEALNMVRLHLLGK